MGVGLRNARKEEDEGDLDCSILLIGEEEASMKKEWSRFCLRMN